MEQGRKKENKKTTSVIAAMNVPLEDLKNHLGTNYSGENLLIANYWQ